MFSARSVALSLLISSLSLVNATPVIDLASRADAANATVAAPSFVYTCNQPPSSTNQAQWSTRAYISQNLPNPLTPPPLFWSGRTGTTSILPAAERCAQQRNAATIGQLMCNLNRAPTNRNFLMPADGSPAAGTDLWDFASLTFAQYTGDTAFVVTGDAFVTSIWFRTEWPALKLNTRLNTVISLNPTGCTNQCHWYCRPGTNCQVNCTCFLF
jgi:hypothetical protein